MPLILFYGASIVAGFFLLNKAGQGIQEGLKLSAINIGQIAIIGLLVFILFMVLSKR